MQIRKIENLLLDNQDNVLAYIEINPLSDLEKRKEIETALQKAFSLYNDHVINLKNKGE